MPICTMRSAQFLERITDAHTHEMLDMPGLFHTEWLVLGDVVKSVSAD